MTSTTTETVPTQKRRNKRQPIIAFGLAVLAVGGIGAAATSAAWSDNTWFSAPAAAATFNLQGSLNGTDWSEGTKTIANGVTTIELKVPADKFANLLPGQTRTVDLWVRNESSVSAALTSTVSFDQGATFTTNPTSEIVDLAPTLTPTSGAGAQDKFQLSVKTPADWAQTNVGASGTVVVTVSATATSADSAS